MLSLNANADLITIDPSPTGGSCCSTAERGYFFEAPEDLTFNSFWLNTQSGLSSNYNLDILLFNSRPLEFALSTTDYVTLGSWDGLSGVFSTNISVNENSIIGLIAWDADLKTTPYADAFSQDINGTSVSFIRLLRQSLINGDPVSASSGIANIASIGFTANGPATGTGATSVPAPATLALLSLGLVGIGFSRKKKSA